MRATVRLPPPPLRAVASAFARILHRNVPRSINVPAIAWSRPPGAVCHALAVARPPPPTLPEPDNALAAWALRMRRLHVVTAWSFAAAMEEFGEPLLHEGQKLEGASISVMEVKKFGPLGRIHVIECDEEQVGLFARNIEQGLVPPTAQPLVGPLPLRSLCTTLYSASAPPIHVHFSPSAFGLRVPLQADSAVPEPLIWSLADQHIVCSQSYPPLRRLNAAQRRELQTKLLGSDSAMAQLCTALVAEARDAAQVLRDEHLEAEKHRFIQQANAANENKTKSDDDDDFDMPPLPSRITMHPTGAGASRALRRPPKKGS